MAMLFDLIRNTKEDFDMEQQTLKCRMK